MQFYNIECTWKGSDQFRRYTHDRKPSQVLIPCSMITASCFSCKIDILKTPADSSPAGVLNEKRYMIILTILV